MCVHDVQCAKQIEGLFEDVFECRGNGGGRVFDSGLLLRI